MEVTLKPHFHKLWCSILLIVNHCPQEFLDLLAPTPSKRDQHLPAFHVTQLGKALAHHLEVCASNLTLCMAAQKGLAIYTRQFALGMQLSPALQSPFSFHLECGYTQKNKQTATRLAERGCSIHQEALLSKQHLWSRHSSLTEQDSHMDSERDFGYLAY